MKKQEYKILVNGAAGKMGRAMGGGIAQEADMRIVAAVDIKGAGTDFGLLAGLDPLGVLVEDDLEKAILALPLEEKPDVMIEFTNANVVLRNVRVALAHGIACVIGTTGLSEEQIKEIETLAKLANTPVFLAPNFALGAVLMMRFAKEAAVYFPHVEVIERHHDQKLDAPSGTAATTLEMIAEVREVFSQGAANEFEKIPGSRGGDYQGMRVHSVRLPGYVASQEVIFGGLAQRLVISHDTISRDSFLPGVLLAIRKVLDLDGLTCGLEKIM